MPFYYDVAPGANFTTSAVANTEIDAMFIAPGAARRVYLSGLAVQGKGAQLTSLSGIVIRVKTWNTTASSGGTAITPSPRDESSPAAGATAGYTSTGLAAPGTGGPSLEKVVGCSGSGPGQWVARENDAAVSLNAGATKSIDLWTSSGTASMVVEVDVEIFE